MKKHPIACLIGTAIILLGFLGVFRAISDIGALPEDRRDVTTTGTVVQLDGTEVRHKIGVTLSTNYSMTYEFFDESGQSRRDSETLNAQQYNALSKGQKIEVKYHSNNPSISASAYGTYRGVDDPIYARSTPVVRILFCLGISLFGLGNILAFVFLVKDEDEPKGIPQQEFSFGNKQSGAF